MTDWVALGTVLVIVGCALVILTQGPTPEAIAGLGTGIGIFGAAMILRSIGPERRDPP